MTDEELFNWLIKNNKRIIKYIYFITGIICTLTILSLSIVEPYLNLIIHVYSKILWFIATITILMTSRFIKKQKEIRDNDLCFLS